MEKIILYGIDVDGEKFYWAYRDCYEIVCCIDRKCYRRFHDIPVYDFDEIEEELKKKEYLIVIAVSLCAYKEISENLQKIGLKEYKDYIAAADIGKKLAVLYGNCHMGILSEYLKNNPAINRKYIINYFYLQKEKLPESILECCELLILQDIRSGNVGHYIDADSLCDMVSRNCRCIKIPNVYGRNFFFPQYKEVKGEECYGLARKEVFERHVNQNAVILYDKQGILNLGNIIRALSIEGGDENIERLYRVNKSVDEIVNFIKNDEVYEAEKIQKIFEEEIRKLVEREKKCDISISDYILENYKFKKLFFEPNHPTNELIKEMGRRILKLINIEIDESVPLKTELDAREIFIYGCVKRALGITFEQKYVRKVNYSEYTLKGRPMDLNEYVESYIKWVCEEE